MKAISDQMDLHGLTAEEAIPVVDRFLERAYRARLPRVWIVHGRGTGTLRAEIAGYLSRHRLVARCSAADPARGGFGASQVEIID